MQYSCPSRKRIYYLETEIQSPCPACGAQLNLAKLMKEWIPPHDVEAEAATLGSMLLEGEAAGLATERLMPEDFYRPGHGTIFQAACEVYDSGQQPDEILVRERLQQKGLLEEVGGAEYIHSLTKSVPAAANLERYAEIIRDRSLARELITACTAILCDAEEAAEMWRLLDRAEQRIYDVASHPHDPRPRPLGQVGPGGRRGGQVYLSRRRAVARVLGILEEASPRAPRSHACDS